MTLTSFTPDPSSIFNPPTGPISIKLAHTVSGLTPSHYRVSHFADFHDSNWIAYVPAPSISMPQSWLTPTSSPGHYSVVLYFQLRAKNPKAGQPISLINGKTQVQPDFLMSTIRNRTITVTLFGVNMFLS